MAAQRDDERRRPQITVRDPAHPQRPVDVLGFGDDELPPPVLTRRRVGVAVAAAVLVAGAAGLLELRDRQAEAAQERQRAGQVSLSVLASRTGSSAVVLRLRNDGPRTVRVLRGGAGSYGVVREAAVPAGGFSSLLLRPPAPCRAAGDTSAAADVLALSVQTQAGCGRSRWRCRSRWAR
jgi:hypothetical protein